MHPSSPKRLWELDSLRGIAILMMVLYHLLFDLSSLGGYSIQVLSGFWLYFARATATLFILLMGVSLTISYAKAKKSRNPGAAILPKYLKRGGEILAWGIVITFVTYFFTRDSVIVFGILHFMGLATMLAYPFLKLRAWNLVLGSSFIALGFYLKNLTFDFPWLVWLGLRPEHFHTLDYFPLFPWFGVVLIGVFLGNTFYPYSVRKLALPDLSHLPLPQLLSSLGRHSLFIYLIHQPILIGVLSLLGIVNLSSLN
ncbi:MAG: DUF1624 domain-containing protein [Chloroflexi bacterium]|nr:DUF1624 domain-containing protein [Chloroflexota bacterium]